MATLGFPEVKRTYRRDCRAFEGNSRTVGGRFPTFARRPDFFMQPVESQRCRRLRLAAFHGRGSIQYIGAQRQPGSGAVPMSHSQNKAHAFPIRCMPHGQRADADWSRGFFQVSSCRLLRRRSVTAPVIRSVAALPLIATPQAVWSKAIEVIPIPPEFAGRHPVFSGRTPL